MAETTIDDSRGNNSGMERSRQQVLEIMSAAVEENALRDAIYRSSRCGWTNTDRSRQQQQQLQQTTDTVCVHRSRQGLGVYGVEPAMMLSQLS